MNMNVEVQRSTSDDLQAALDGPLGHHGVIPVALALADLDRFAEINERHGREAGDRVLSSWELVLSTNLPQGSSVFRLGGDEYGVVLPGSSAENALILLDEIRNHFAASSVAGVDHPLAVTIGVAARPAHAKTAEDLYRAAAEALMRAKRDEPGSVAIHVDEKMVLKTSYYRRSALDRLSRLAMVSSRTEASLLREALDDLVQKYRDEV